MIIGIDGHMIGDRSGGNESYYSNILRAMNTRKNDTVYLFVKKGIDVSEYENKFIIVRFDTDSPIVRNYYYLNHYSKLYKLDVLHTQCFIPFIRSCKVVCTIHDICFEHYNDIFTTKEYYQQKLLIPYAARKSQFIFTVSEHSKKDIVESYGINPQKVIVTYNAVNEKFRVLSQKELNEAELRNRYGIGNEEYLLTVGNLQPRKNLPRLIEAFIQWKMESHRTTKLVIVGKKAWMFSDILAGVSSAEGSVILTDYVSTEDLVRLYNAAECFVYPSFYEGFGIPPIEAMACGTPVAVANTTSLPEVVADAGVFFDPFDVEDIKFAINKIMGNETVKKELRQKGMKRKDAFNWLDSANKIYDTYHLCLEETS